MPCTNCCSTLLPALPCARPRASRKWHRCACRHRPCSLWALPKTKPCWTTTHAHSWVIGCCKNISSCPRNSCSLILSAWIFRGSNKQLKLPSSSTHLVARNACNGWNKRSLPIPSGCFARRWSIYSNNKASPSGWRTSVTSIRLSRTYVDHWGWRCIRWIGYANSAAAPPAMIRWNSTRRIRYSMPCMTMAKATIGICSDGPRCCPMMTAPM